MKGRRSFHRPRRRYIKVQRLYYTEGANPKTDITPGLNHSLSTRQYKQLKQELHFTSPHTPSNKVGANTISSTYTPNHPIYSWRDFSTPMHGFLKFTFSRWHTTSWELNSSLPDVIETTIKRIPESKHFRSNLVS